MSLNKIKIPIIYHGKDSLKELKKLKEQKILIITDKTVKNLHEELILKYLKKKECIFFDDVEPNPKDTMIMKGNEIALDFNPDLIIGLGGGSVMDTAKTVYFLYETEKDSIYECNPVTSYNLGQKSRLILIPTTSGTGAEHTPASIVTNSETGQKVTVASNEIIPAAVFLDSRLSALMPLELTISTGLDALVHAIEGITSRMRSDFSDAMNFHAIRLLTKFLPQVFKENENKNYIREKLHNAASIAGIGMGNSSCGLAHSCGHALGALHPVAHGLAVGIMLPYTIEFNKRKCAENYEEILNCINILKYNDSTSELVNYFRNFLKKINIPVLLKEIIPNEKEWNQKLEKLISFAKKDILTPFNPRPVSEDDFKKIFEYAYLGKSIDF
ncbi:MAG: iron-containing alcohol dehydrogenase [Promethearchaeota archaeon]